jgi:hypothetical protein
LTPVSANLAGGARDDGLLPDPVPGLIDGELGGVVPG